MTRQREPAQGGSIEELEAGREYATQNGFYKIIALDGETVQKRPKAGGDPSGIPFNGHQKRQNERTGDHGNSKISRIYEEICGIFRPNHR